jgi:hypothetical protein
MMAKAVKVSVEVPEGVSEETRATVQRKAHETSVLHLWESGDLSTRQVADELGLTYRDYLDLLAERGIPVESGMFDEDALERARQKLVESRP